HDIQSYLTVTSFRSRIIAVMAQHGTVVSSGFVYCGTTTCWRHSWELLWEGRYVVVILTVFSLHNKCSQFTLEVFATVLQLLSHIDPAKVYKYNRFNFFHHTCIGRFESQCNILKRTMDTFEYCFIPQANQLRLPLFAIPK
uniref:Uncharacterized protein n=1 Tax=Aegilops tauschii subsp. strangulata TaxID=200361 RepID=A0A453PQT6_AEGTS